MYLDPQDISNGNRTAANIHRGEDFQKKLLFYERNSLNNNSPFRRSSFQQSFVSPKPFAQQLSSRSNYSINTKPDHMQRSKSSKDLFESPIAHPSFTQQQTSMTYLNNQIGLIESQQKQYLASNLLADDVSTSSTGHLPKPPPGVPNQNVRYVYINTNLFSLKGKTRFVLDVVDTKSIIHQ